MSTGYQIDDQYGLYFLTLTIVDWVDVFSRSTYRNIFLDSLQYCVLQKELKVYGYVIMTNHVHLIVQSRKGDLSGTIRDLKKYTSRKIVEAIKTEPESRREWILHRFEWNAAQTKRSVDNQVWTHENHAVSITSEKFFQQKLKYLHENPMRAGWVKREEDYVHSSAYALYNNVRDVIDLSYW